MNILIFNCGSSSLKYRLISMPEENEILSGEAQRIGPKTSEPARIIHRYNNKEEKIITEMIDHKDAFEKVLNIINNSNAAEPDIFGHRLVHGGDFFKKPAIVTKEVLNKLMLTRSLAPIHNPPAIELIKACSTICSKVPQILVFDTAFHSTIPDYAYYYTIPKKIQDDLKIKKYGFHGTSHFYVVKEAAKYLDIPLHKLNVVSCHLGSGGASLCAVKNGKSIDNTMGYSPLQGLIMSTRCGDIDPAIVLKLLIINNCEVNEIDKLLNNKSGVLGLSGKSADIRDILPNKNIDFEQLNNILQTYIWRIKKYLGSYITICSPLDAIILTDTIGEEVPYIRKLICEHMDFFGVGLDEKKNKNIKKYPNDISNKKSKVKILVIKTNEELEIARNCYSVLKTKGIKI